jgi:hypothetical protein
MTDCPNCEYHRKRAQRWREEAYKQAGHPLPEREQLREENERLHVENRRLIERIETIGVPVGVGGFATTTSAQAEQQLITTVDIEKIAKFKERNP